MLYLGWIFPFIMILGLKQFWISCWIYLCGLTGGTGSLLYLAFIFLGVSFAAFAAHFLTSKKKPNWRFNWYLVGILCFWEFLMLLLNYYLAWETLIWF